MNKVLIHKETEKVKIMEDYDIYFKNSFDGVLIFDLEGNLIYKNKVADKILQNETIRHFDEIMYDLKCGTDFSAVKNSCNRNEAFSCISMGVKINYSYSKSQKIYIMQINYIANVLDMNLSDDAADAFLVFSPDMDIIYVNKAACELFEVSKKELLSMQYTEIFDDDHIGQLHPKIDELTVDKSLVVERKLKTKSGRVVYVELHTKLFENQHYFTVIRNIDLRHKFRKELERKNIALEEESRKLAKSELNYRYLFDNFPVGVVVSDPNGKINQINYKMLEILGASSKIDGMQFNLLDTLKRKQSELYKDVKLCLAKRVKIEKFYEYSSRWDKELYVKVQTIPCKAGVSDGVMLLVEDHSKQKENARIMHIFSEGLANSSNSIIVTDIKGNISFVNQKTLDLTGYERMEIIDNSIDIFKYAEYNSFYSKVVDTVKKDMDWQGEARTCKKDGTTFWVNAHVVHIKNSQGVVNNFLIIQEDITEKREIMSELRLSNQQLEVLIGNIPDMILLKSQDDTWLKANSAALSIFGIPHDCDYQGKTSAELAKHCCRNFDFLSTVASVDEKVWQLGIRQEFETILTDEEGKEINVKMAKYPLFRENGERKGLVTIGQNITKNKKYEESLKLAKEKAEHADRLKSKFLANMSHEIKTPLQVIQGFASLLADYEFEKKEKLKYKTRIKEGSDTLIGIIDDMLYYSDLQAEKRKIKYITFDIIKSFTKLKKDCTKTLKYSAKSDIKLKMHNESEANSVWITSDMDIFVEIFKRVLANAIKFTEKGSITFGFNLDSDNEIVFFVEDTGIGIDEENIDIIFEPFSQIEDAIIGKHGGTGLGLTIVKCLVELLGGKIWLESKLDEGSAFYFKIPNLKVEFSDKQLV